MIYSEEQRDLFSVSDDYYLVQCISADFAMGAGIAVQFNEHFNTRENLRRSHYNMLSEWDKSLAKGFCIQDGKVFLSSICDRFIHKTPDGGSVTAGLLYPSKYLSVYMANVDQKVCDMFRGLGLKNGVLFMQAFVENENFYFYEMGYRLSGGRHYLFTENQNGTNACKELVHFAVTGSMSDQDLSRLANPNYSALCYQLSILCYGEKICSIDGWNDIVNMKGVIDATSYYNVGDTIGKEGTTASIFAKIHLVAQDEDTLKKDIEYIYANLKVLNHIGKNIIIGKENNA